MYLTSSQSWWSLRRWRWRLVFTVTICPTTARRRFSRRRPNSRPETPKPRGFCCRKGATPKEMKMPYSSSAKSSEMSEENDRLCKWLLVMLMNCLGLLKLMKMIADDGPWLSLIVHKSMIIDNRSVVGDDGRRFRIGNLESGVNCSYVSLQKIPTVPTGLLLPIFIFNYVPSKFSLLPPEIQRDIHQKPREIGTLGRRLKGELRSRAVESETTRLCRKWRRQRTRWRSVGGDWVKIWGGMKSWMA